MQQFAFFSEPSMLKSRCGGKAEHSLQPHSTCSDNKPGASSNAQVVPVAQQIIVVKLYTRSVPQPELH